MNWNRLRFFQLATIAWNDGEYAGFEETSGKRTVIFRPQIKDEATGEICTREQFLRFFPLGGSVNTKYFVYRKLARPVSEISTPAKGVSA